MEQQLHDKSETFKIIYKALLLQIIWMEFSKSKLIWTYILYICVYIFLAILLACIYRIYFDLPYVCPVPVSCLLQLQSESSI